jgi:hypothetical protein
MLAVSVLASRPACAQTSSATDHAPAPVNLRDTAIGPSETPREVVNGTAKLIGPYDRTAKMHVVLGINPPKMAEEDEFLRQLQDKNSPNFHKYLTAEQWNARFAPSAKDEQAVVDWATSNGLTVTKRFKSRLIVDVEATPEAFERAFAVQINSYKVGDNVEFSNDRDPVIPANLTGILHSVGGLNSIQRMHAAHERTVPPKFPGDSSAVLQSIHEDGDPVAFREAMKASAARMAESSSELKGAIGAESKSTGLQPNVTNGYLDPTDIYSYYGYDYGALQGLGHCCNPTGNSGGTPPDTTIGIATAGDFANSDITGFHDQYSYLAGHIDRVWVDGTPACCNDETTLDTEWSMATSNSFGSYLNTAHIYVYEAANTYLSTFSDVYTKMLDDGYARVFTTSWGCAEIECASTSRMDTDDATFKSMVGQGWTLMAASGDKGATAGCDDALRVQHPSSDPYVVGVGGTSLAFYNNGTFDFETGWQGSTGSGACAGNGGGSTGGCSAYYAAPSYQTTPACGTGSRSVPDVALNSGYGQNYYFDGALSGAGGTSIASPQVAGFMAQANAYMLALGVGCGTDAGSTCAPLGQPHSAIYYEGYTGNYSQHNPYYDEVSGCNDNDITVEYGLGYYCAVAGYDLVTGWGSFNALQMAWMLNWYDFREAGNPSVSFTGPAINTWYNSNQTVSWTVVDNVTNSTVYPGTGIAGFTQGWDSIPTDSASQAVDARAVSVYDSFYIGPEYVNASTGCLALAAGGCGGGSGQGCHTVHVEGWNNMGRTNGNATYGPICYDTVAPTITISNSPLPNGSGWNNTSVQITLTATDPGGSDASGIYKTYYAINTTACTPTSLGSCAVYSGPFSITGQGYNYVFYFTEDNAGNFSTETYEWVYIDETAPVTTAALSGTLNGSVYNSAVKVTLSATDNLSGVKTTYYSLDGGTNTTYTAALNVTALGSHSVKFYSVDYAGNTETTKTVSFTISQASQTITFANPGTQTYGTPLTLTATASSGLTVSYASMTTAVCTVSGSVVSFASPGTCTIQATQAGSTYIAAATPVTQSFAVNKEAQTITWASPGPQTYGTPLTLSATASSGLPVSFAAAPSTSSVCTVSGTTATFLTAGTCTIAATQAGNGDYLAAPAVGHTFYVNPATQTITFPNPGTQTVGAVVTLTATASSGLTVSYTSSTSSVCTITTSTTATMNAAGTCTIKATQAGNGGYKAAPAVSQSFTVNKDAQTITWANPGPQTYGTPLTLSATASSGLPVSFNAAPSTSSVCTVSGTTATFLTAGTCSISATQAGNSEYAAAPTVGHTFYVNPAAQTITFPNPGTQTVGAVVTLTATASSGLTVSYTSSTSSVCTITTSTTATMNATGTCTIKATQAGNGGYKAAPAVSQSFTVNKGAQTITWASPGPQTYGTPLTLSATASSGLPVSFAAAPSTSSVCTVSGTTATFLTTGTCTIAATQAGNSNYAAAPTVGHTFYVNPATQTITFPNPGTQTVGAVVTLTATASSGLTVSYTSSTSSVCTITTSTTATMKAAGTCTIAAAQAGNADYRAAPAVSQSFTVTAPI